MSRNVIDIEILLRSNGAQLTPAVLRRIACECCRRISHLCDRPIYWKMLRVVNDSAARHAGEISRERLNELSNEYQQLHQELYPGHGSPTAEVLALVAVGEATREPALEAAISAATTAAEAVALGAAADADDGMYDEVHQATFLDECQTQLQLLEELAPHVDWSRSMSS